MVAIAIFTAIKLLGGERIGAEVVVFEFGKTADSIGKKSEGGRGLWENKKKMTLYKNYLTKVSFCGKLVGAVIVSNRLALRSLVGLTLPT